MVDLPPARLCLYEPPFYLAGVDCFSPLTAKIGQQTKKRWSIVGIVPGLLLMPEGEPGNIFLLFTHIYFEDICV